MRLLIVEDEYRLADMVRDWLIKENNDVDIATDGVEGYHMAMLGIYDVIILDVMLPEMNGFEILQKIRQAHNPARVLMLTAKSDLDHKIHGLDIGADDYMTKPFEIRELLARVRALMRRNHNSESMESLSIGDLQLDVREHELFCEKSGHRIKLTEKEYLLMEYMILNRNQVLTKEQISNRIWGHELKTPLAVMRTSLDTMKNEGQGGKYLDYALEKNTRMTALVHEMLTLSSLEQSCPDIKCERMNMQKAVEGGSLPFEVMAYERGVIFELELDSEIYVCADTEKIQQMVGILLDNAIRHTKPSGSCHSKVQW